METLDWPVWEKLNWPPCEVCGAASDWRSGPLEAEELILEGPKCMWFLCREHAAAWSNWERRDSVFFKWHRMPDGGESDDIRQWLFTLFVREAKGELKTCPFCGRTLEERDDR